MEGGGIEMALLVEEEEGEGCREIFRGGGASIRYLGRVAEMAVWRCRCRRIEAAPGKGEKDQQVRRNAVRGVLEVGM